MLFLSLFMVTVRLKDVFMKTILTCSEMKSLDAYTIREMGVPSAVLMERAALSVAEKIMEYLSGKPEASVLCVCGSGNNGGDGVAVARLLHNAGLRAVICMAGNEAHFTEETARQVRIAKNYGVPFADADSVDMNGFQVIVDALFGVGLSRTIEGKYAALIDRINRSNVYKAAVDIPSGIHGDTGQVMGTAVKCDLTVTFAYKKSGHLLYPGRTFSGHTICADIGIYSHGGNSYAKSFEPQDAAGFLERDPAGNKASFGKILFLAGSAGMCGAAYLCAAGALRTGAGMVMIRTPEENRIPLQTLLPEALLSLRADSEERRRVYEWCDIASAGCGLGKSEDSVSELLSLLQYCRETEKPLVLDADALNLLAEHPDWYSFLGPNTVLTPHPGEMSRISGFSIEEIKADPVRTASEFAKRTGAVIVQKDACTVTASPDGEIYINESGNSGMGTAGSGDVLCGIISGVLAVSRHLRSGKSPAGPAAAGVYLHGMAGDRAAAELGMSGMKAGDIIDFLPRIS